MWAAGLHSKPVVSPLAPLISFHTHTLSHTPKGAFFFCFRRRWVVKLVTTREKSCVFFTFLFRRSPRFALFIGVPIFWLFLMMMTMTMMMMMMMGG